MLRRAAILGFLALASQGVSLPRLPRKAPEFTIVEPSGKQTPLSSYRGKVVLVEFLLTWCEHCQNTAKMVKTVYEDLGPRGFQAIGVAFNQNAAALVPAFVTQLGIPFPVGYTDINTVANYVGVSANDRIMAPQILLIDKKGIIRAQSSPPQGDPNLTDETKLRAMIESLLKEK